jgi:hypothetical protein
MTIELDTATAAQYAGALRQLAELLDHAGDRGQRRGLAALAAALHHAAAEARFAADLEQAFDTTVPRASC